MHMDKNTRHQIFETGSDESVEQRLIAHAGDISVIIDAGALRCISIDSVEVLRQLDFPVRDENWSSWPPHVTQENLIQYEDSFRYERYFDVADDALSCCIVYEAKSNGTLTASAEVLAKRDFATNRTGFTLLHPISGVTAQTVSVTTASGDLLETHMPDLISPSQPIKNISKLAFSIKGLTLDIAFSGETFEMEDQRNWSDASFKTYSRPLSKPCPYHITAGCTVRQKIELHVAGKAEASKPLSAQTVTVSPPLDEAMPEILLAAQEHWFAEEKGKAILSRSNLKSLLLRTTAIKSSADLKQARDFLSRSETKLDLEFILDDDLPADAQLLLLAHHCASLHIEPGHMTSLPAAYLNSYQPDGQWPESMSPKAAFSATRQAFKRTRIGSGMLSNFTEFNRCPPHGIPSDYVTHGNTANFHAADDYSVRQTLETLPDIFRSAQAIAGDRGYRLGLIAIGSRSNPYGEAVTSNPDQRRLTAAMWDPRARALMGAAYAVGVLSATQGFAVEAIALAAPTGPFGILSSPADVARPWFDDNPKACVYPIFHILNTVATGGTRFRVEGLSTGLAGFAFSHGKHVMLLVSNLSSNSKTLTLEPTGHAAILDVDSFESAVCDPDWLSNSLTPLTSQQIVLSPSATLFLEFGDKSPSKPES